jgi:hypothetical protein
MDLFANWDALQACDASDKLAELVSVVRRFVRGA